MRSIENSILVEIQSHFKEKHSEWTVEERVYSYLNNFPTKIPGRDGISDAELFLLSEDAGIRDQRLKEKRESRPIQFNENNQEEIDEIRREGYIIGLCLALISSFLMI